MKPKARDIALAAVALVVMAGLNATAYPPSGRYSVTIDSSGAVTPSGGLTCTGLGLPPGPGGGLETRCIGTGATVCGDPEVQAEIFLDELDAIALCDTTPGLPSTLWAACHARWTWAHGASPATCGAITAGAVAAAATDLELICHAIPEIGVGPWKVTCTFDIA